MKLNRLIHEYFKWYKKARNRHGIHSPFIYHFVENCLNKDDKAPFFHEIENLRQELFSSDTILDYNDPGAGSRAIKSHAKTVKKLAHTSLQKPKYCRFLHRLATYLNVTHALELGTSFGITTSYLSCASDHIRIDTIEGVQVIADIAETNFKKLQIQNIHLHRGTFSQILPALLNKKYDLVFIDGDHRGDKLLSYFEDIVKHISEKGVIVIDDIRWSDSMLLAWQKIIARPDVAVSVDLFSMGLIFFRPGMSKENFYLKFK
jgi:predicted O-methyltransferase YrrM